MAGTWTVPSPGYRLSRPTGGLRQVWFDVSEGKEKQYRLPSQRKILIGHRMSQLQSDLELATHESCGN